MYKRQGSSLTGVLYISTTNKKVVPVQAMDNKIKVFIDHYSDPLTAVSGTVELCENYRTNTGRVIYENNVTIQRELTFVGIFRRPNYVTQFPPTRRRS